MTRKKGFILQRMYLKMVQDNEKKKHIWVHNAFNFQQDWTGFNVWVWIFFYNFSWQCYPCISLFCPQYIYGKALVLSVLHRYIIQVDGQRALTAIVILRVWPIYSLTQPIRRAVEVGQVAQSVKLLYSVQYRYCMTWHVWHSHVARLPHILYSHKGNRFSAM